MVWRGRKERRGIEIEKEVRWEGEKREVGGGSWIERRKKTSGTKMGKNRSRTETEEEVGWRGERRTPAVQYSLYRHHCN